MRKILNQTRRRVHALMVILAAILAGACADPRTNPTTAPDPGYTETIVLWDSVLSNGEVLTAQFNVDQQLATIQTPGVDAPARLTLAAFIHYDGDLYWYEGIVEDSIPAWTPKFISYLIAIEQHQGVIDAIAAGRALCDTLPEQCPDDTSSWIADEAEALEQRALYQDSVAAGQADTTRLGVARDSLGVVLDDRYTVAIWLDDDTTTVYPEAVFATDGRLDGQELYLAETRIDTAATPDDTTKGRGFTLDLAQFSAAQWGNPGRPIEINWVSEFPGTDSPWLSPGQHTLRARVTGNRTSLTGVLVLVYAEERP
ncbi:hypothetical protein IT157_09215 [bacterium]|nr:hypothetical protein [bacterium]